MNDVLSPIEAELEAGLSVAAELMRKGFVSTADVGRFRRECFAERSPSRAELEALLALDQTLRPGSRAWQEFLVEAVMDHAIWDARPTGIVTAADAEWLLQWADRAKTPASFAVLVHLADEAHQVPNGFVAAVRQRAVAGWHGVGASAQGFAPAAWAA